MSDQNQPTRKRAQESNPVPNWYVLFYKIYMPCWWIGTALIVLSWFQVVTSTVGWIGFTLACAATLGAYVLPSFAGIKPEDLVFLDSRLLRTQGDAYQRVMERFLDGATLMYDGVAFGFRPNDSIACGLFADNADIDEQEALELVEHARSVFNALLSESPEFKSAVEGQNFRISIMLENNESVDEICRFVDGQLDWQNSRGQ